MTKLKDFFKLIKWWEALFLLVYFIAAIAVGTVFNSGTIIILNAIFAVIANFFVAKGMAIGNVFGMINLFLYCTTCFYNRFYGEIICSALITFPSYALSLYTWLKTKRKDEAVLCVTKSICLIEWCLTLAAVSCLSVGIYFLLNSFNTENLIVSTFATSLGMLAGYLIIRRCEFNFLFYLMTNIVCIVLWISSIGSEGFANLPIVVVYFMFLFINSFGLFNWIRLKRLQNGEGDLVTKMLKICKNDL